MKVGIITFWETQDNYGQMMQIYALQRVLENLGHEPFLIRYSLFDDWAVNPNRWKSLLNPKKIVLYLKRKIIPHKNIMNTTEVNRNFDMFKEQYIYSTKIIYKSLKALQENPPKADVYICGSDQIWYACENYLVYKNITRAYFLDFGEDGVKRIAYAPSFGRTDYPQGYCDFIKPLLRKFNLVTVREKGGIEVCKRAGYDNAIQVLDPTCLLLEEHYHRLAIRPTIECKYVLIYWIGSKQMSEMNEIFNFSIQKGYKIICIASQGNSINGWPEEIEFVYPTVQEWLGWIEHSEFVFTNSFHGSVFSILFNRQNAVFTNEGISRKGNDDRFYTLLDSLNLLDRVYQGNNIEYLLNTAIHYNDVNTYLDNKRKHDISILEKSINS